MVDQVKCTLKLGIPKPRKNYQIEISTDSFEDAVFDTSAAFIEYKDGNAFIAYSPHATNQDYDDGKVNYYQVGISNELKF